jgi:probable HAF family extracellular repeat protein
MDFGGPRRRVRVTRLQFRESATTSGIPLERFLDDLPQITDIFPILTAGQDLGPLACRASGAMARRTAHVIERSFPDHAWADLFARAAGAGERSWTELLNDRSRHANGINTAGDIVGESDGTAFFYRKGVMTDLNSLLTPDSPHVGWASGINDSGQIVGLVWTSPCGHGVLLTPVTGSAPQ